MITNSMSLLHPRPLSDLSNANGSFLIDSPVAAETVENIFAKYFVGRSQVSWQRKHLNMT